MVQDQEDAAYRKDAAVVASVRRSILRHRRRTGSDVPARLLYSSRSWQDVIYRDELGQDHDGVQVSYMLTRGHPAGWTGHTGRIDSALLEQVAWPSR